MNGNAGLHGKETQMQVAETGVIGMIVELEIILENKQLGVRHFGYKG